MKLEIALSRSGIASRRHASSLIEEGRVRVDGHIQYTPSTEVNPSSQLITIDGIALPPLEPLVYYAFHKPRGCSRLGSNEINWDNKIICRMSIPMKKVKTKDAQSMIC